MALRNRLFLDNNNVFEYFIKDDVYYKFDFARDRAIEVHNSINNHSIVIRALDGEDLSTVYYAQSVINKNEFDVQLTRVRLIMNKI